MINMLRALMRKGDHVRTDAQYKQKDEKKAKLLQK